MTRKEIVDYLVDELKIDKNVVAKALASNIIFGEKEFYEAVNSGDMMAMREVTLLPTNKETALDVLSGSNKFTMNGKYFKVEVTS